MPICLLLAFFIHDYDFLTTIEIASERSILRSFLVTQYSNRSYAVALYSFFIAFAHSIAASALITGRTSPGPQTCPRY